MGQPYQIDGSDDEASLWENSVAFRRLIYVAVLFALIVLCGFFLSYSLQAYQRQIDIINQQYQQETGTKDKLIDDVLPKKNNNPVLTANPKAAAMLNHKRLDEYPLVSENWKKNFNLSDTIPKTGFDVYYFDTKNPNRVVFKEHNSHIATYYYGEKFKGLDTKSFGAYWVGKVRAKEDGIYHIKAYDTPKNTKILLDGRLIDEKSLNANNGSGAAIFLKKGDYILEVKSESSEILLNTQLIADYIRKGEIHEIKPVMTRSRDIGMQTFDQALFDLYESGQITYDSVIKHADSPNDLRLQIKLKGKNTGQDLNEGANKLSIDDMDY